MKTCTDCKWFVVNPNPYYGRCHRNPPIFTAQLSDYGKFPIVNRDEFCGEFKAKVKGKVKD